MARAALTIQQLDRGGVTPAYAAAIADGHSFVNDGRTILHVKNTGAQITLTIQLPGTIDGQAVADRTVTIPATTGDKMLGPFRKSQYNQADGAVYVDYSSPTGVSIAAIRT